MRNRRALGLVAFAALVIGCTGAAVFADNPAPVAGPKTQQTGLDRASDAGPEDIGLSPVRK